MRTRLGFTIGVIAMGALLSASLWAHVKFEKSDPAADSTVTAPLNTVQIWFSETPDPKLSKLELTGPSGAVKVTGLHAMGKSLMGTVDGTTPPGKYTVSWQSSGDDGHLQKGTFTFTLKSAK